MAARRRGRLAAACELPGTDATDRAHWYDLDGHGRRRWRPPCGTSTTVPIDGCPFDAQPADARCAEAERRVGRRPGGPDDFDPVQPALHAARAPVGAARGCARARARRARLLPRRLLPPQRPARGRGAVTGIVDWGGPGVGDRYLDLALAARSIVANTGSAELAVRFFAAYGIDAPDGRKVDWFVLLDEFLCMPTTYAGLVHSPLVGPATWAPVAIELRHHGHPVVVPALTPPAHLRPPYLPVGHRRSGRAPSGARATRGTTPSCSPATAVPGRACPAIAAALAGAGFPVVATIFVDAGLPLDGRTPAPGRAHRVRRDCSTRLTGADGLLPPWSSGGAPTRWRTSSPTPTCGSGIERECEPDPGSPLRRAGARPRRLAERTVAPTCRFTYDDEAADGRARRMADRPPRRPPPPPRHPPARAPRPRSSTSPSAAR